jgi:hypothetical protein
MSKFEANTRLLIVLIAVLGVLYVAATRGPEEPLPAFVKHDPGIQEDMQMCFDMDTEAVVFYRSENGVVEPARVECNYEGAE